MLWMVGQGRGIRATRQALFFPDVLKPNNLLPVYDFWRQEVGQRPHPYFLLTVLRNVDDHFFQCLGVGGRADDTVEVAFEVAVETGQGKRVVVLRVHTG